jgi:putative hydrolase of the HAD superfamily
MAQARITTIFQDIGGVLLTNGWDHNSRRRAAEKFGFDYEEMNQLHDLTFGTYEEGKISLDEYLKRVVFHRERSFSLEEFKSFLFAQSKAYPEMIRLIRELKSRYRLKVVAVSNEGLELTLYRNERFRLPELIDFFVSSCFVHLRKPDEDIYRMALDIAQVPPGQVIYIENTPMFLDVARNLGIQGIGHVDYESTKTDLKRAGLALD